MVYWFLQSWPGHSGHYFCCNPFPWGLPDKQVCLSWPSKRSVPASAQWVSRIQNMSIIPGSNLYTSDESPFRPTLSFINMSGWNLLIFISSFDQVYLHILQCFRTFVPRPPTTPCSAPDVSPAPPSTRSAARSGPGSFSALDLRSLNRGPRNDGRFLGGRLHWFKHLIWWKNCFLVV